MKKVQKKDDFSSFIDKARKWIAEQSLVLTITKISRSLKAVINVLRLLRRCRLVIVITVIYNDGTSIHLKSKVGKL